MAGFWRTITVKKFCELVLPFILAIIAGLVLFRYPTGWPLQDFVRLMRDALLVSGIIGLLIELWGASIIIDHVTEQLSVRLVGYGLPAAAQELIHQLVHETWRVYRDYRRTYRIENHPSIENYVRIFTTISFKVVNNSRSAQKYEPPFLEEGIYNPQVLKLQCDDRVFGPAELNRACGEHDVVSYSPKKPLKITLKPSDATIPIENLRHDEVCSVYWSFTLDMPNNYSDITAFSCVTINPTVELESIAGGLEFSAGSDESLEDKSQVGRSTWTYRRAFIGGQHLRVWWKPKVT